MSCPHLCRISQFVQYCNNKCGHLKPVTATVINGAITDTPVLLIPLCLARGCLKGLLDP